MHCIRGALWVTDVPVYHSRMILPLITRERELFSEIAINFYKPSEFSEDLSGKFILPHERRTLALDW